MLLCFVNYVDPKSHPNSASTFLFPSGPFILLVMGWVILLIEGEIKPVAIWISSTLANPTDAIQVHEKVTDFIVPFHTMGKT